MVTLGVDDAVLTPDGVLMPLTPLRHLDLVCEEPHGLDLFGGLHEFETPGLYMILL